MEGSDDDEVMFNQSGDEEVFVSPVRRVHDDNAEFLETSKWPIAADDQIQSKSGKTDSK